MSQSVQSSASWGRKVPGRRHWRVSVALAMLLPLLQVTGRAPSPALASSYNCPPTGTHCFGIVSWPGPVTGAETSITMRGLHYGTWPGFMNNELWLIGHPSAGQPNCDFQGYATDCWVEVGNHVGALYHGDNNTPWGTCAPDCYWWADERPSSNGVANYHDHLVAWIPQGDFGGGSTQFSIYDNGSGTWNISILGASNDSWIPQSTGNYMDTNNSTGSFQLGGEFADSASSGASAPLADYTYTAYRDGSGGWYYQGSNGTPGGFWYLPGNGFQSNSVWNAVWASTPSTDHTGGDWQTSCGC